MIGQLRIERPNGSTIVATLRDNLTWETTNRLLAEFLAEYVPDEENATAVGWPGHSQLLQAGKALGAVVELQEIELVEGRVY